MNNDQNQTIAQLQAEIAGLEAAAAALAALPDEQQRLLAQLDEKRRALARLQAPAAAPVVAAALGAARDVNIATHLTVNNLGPLIYGPDPTAEQHEQLLRYLQRLAAKLQRLPLHGLAARLDDGQGIPLEKVYVTLATTDRVEVARDGAAGAARRVADFYQGGDPARPLCEDYDPDLVLPDQAIIAAEAITHQDQQGRSLSGRALYRARLASEAAQQHQQIVLLGSPGSGKSTFLRHLAWSMALRGLDQPSADTALFGWDDAARLLPVLLPLRTLAGWIAVEGAEAATVSAALCEELLREYDVRRADDLLDQTLAGGVLLLLLDGLDEVPLEAVPGKSADRRTTLRAVRAFTELHAGVRAVVTCRTCALDPALGDCLGWPVASLAPLSLSQIRHFAAEWYAALVARGSLTRDQGESQEATLTGAITGSARLRTMAENPLLLTMMALVLAEKGELPRDRPLLYERILEQLLGQWDQQKGGQSLAEVIGGTNLRCDDLRPILDRLSYEAHLGAASPDGRGRLVAKDLRYALAEFLSTVRVDGAWEAAGRCLAYFYERSGLLQPEDDGAAFAFAHLTLQEHGAGRHMLLQPNAAELVLFHRADDRWREPIALGLGVIQKIFPPLADRIERVLADLIDADEQGHPKPTARWYRDLILASELGRERDWNLLRALINVDRLQRELRRGLAALLADPAQPLPVAERLRAACLLGELGDPRIPVTLEDWRREIERARALDPGGYLCRVDAGSYAIGSAADDPDARGDEQPQHEVAFDAPFWVARFPITNAQWQTWVAVGGQRSPYADDDDLNRPNQPVSGVRWIMCNAFCGWMSAQLGVTVRLPTEAEWEAAARGPDARRYPWGDSWQDDRAATEEDRDARGMRYPVPVGCYPSGAAACGARDLAGNVWEWTADTWCSYPGAQQPFADEALRVLRGGAFNDQRAHARGAARFPIRPDYLSAGFRVVVLLPRPPEEGA